MRSHSTPRLLALAGTAVALGVAGTSGAQTTGPAGAQTPPPAQTQQPPAQTPAQPPAQAPAQPQPGQAGPPTDAEVESFARAYVGIAQVQRQAQAELQQAGPEEQPQIEQRMQQQMAATVTQAGLTPQRFNDIAQASQSDPQLAGRIQQEVQAAAR